MLLIVVTVILVAVVGSVVLCDLEDFTDLKINTVLRAVIIFFCSIVVIFSGTYSGFWEKKIMLYTKPKW